jgi:hypothetical protein
VDLGQNSPHIEHNPAFNGDSVYFGAPRAKPVDGRDLINSGAFQLVAGEFGHATGSLISHHIEALRQRRGAGRKASWEPVGFEYIGSGYHTNALRTGPGYRTMTPPMLSFPYHPRRRGPPILPDFPSPPPAPSIGTRAASIIPKVLRDRPPCMFSAGFPADLCVTLASFD